MNRKQQKKTTLLLSLLLHILVLCFVFYFGFKVKKPIKFEKLTKEQQAKIMKRRQQLLQQKQKQQERMRAALFPKRSDEGTKVVFDNEKILEDKIKEKPVEKIVTKQVKKLVEKKKPVKEIKEQFKPKQQHIVKKKNSKITSKIPELKSQEKIEKKVLAKKALTKKPIDKKVTKPEIVKVTLPTTHNIIKTPVKPKPKNKSLLSLTKCFLDHHKGNSSMFRFGQDRKPTFEEMKYICYEKQLQDALVTSWKVMYAGMQVQTPGEVRFTFLVNEHGKSEEIKLMQSSGSPTFDKMVLKSVKHASFPPIPKHFGVKKYRPQGGIILLR